jgi:hypothetical protein
MIGHPSLLAHVGYTILLRPCNAIAAKEKVAAIAIADKPVPLRQWQDFVEASEIRSSINEIIIVSLDIHHHLLY